MRLPGPDYSTSTPSQGTRDVNAPLAVAGSYASAANAKGVVVAALNNLSGIAEAWAEAEDRAAASKAYSEYKEKMGQATVELSKSPTIKASEIPDGVAFKRTETRLVDGAATEVDREIIPTWEVAPAIYDKISKEAQAAAMKAPQLRSTRAWLENNLRDANAHASNQIAAYHFEGRKAALHGTFEASVQSLVNSGDSKGALGVLDEAEKAGVIDPTAAVKRRQRIMNDSANMLVSKQIIQESDPDKLEAIGDQVLNSKGVLTDEQAASLSKSALAKAERIRKQEEVIEQKQKKAASSALLTDFVTGVRLNKTLPSKIQMQSLIAKMTPEDARHALTLYDKKDGGEGGASDPATVAILDKKLVGTMNTGTAPLDQNIREYQRELDRQLSLGKINIKDWAVRVAQAKNMGDRVTVDDPNYQAATKSIYFSITKNAKGTLFLPEGSRARYGVAEEMEFALLQAKMQKPDTDPVRWVDENLPKYKQKADKSTEDALTDKNLGGFIRRSNLGFDYAGTMTAVQDAHKSKKITDAQYENAVNILQDKPSAAAIKAREALKQ